MTGHGIGPALLAAECRALVRAASLQTDDLTKLAGQVNALLCDDMTDGRFVTTFLGRLWPGQHRLTLLSAGHGPILHYQAATDELRELPPHGIPLGIVADYAYDRQEEVALEPGDFLAVFTDGFVEWPRVGGDRYGTERLRALLRRDRALPAADILRRAYDAVLTFAAGEPQHDDLTAVLVKRD